MSNGRYAGVIPEKEVVTIITDDNPVLLVKQAEEAGRLLADQGLTKNQVRAIFGAVRQIQMSWPESLKGEAARPQVRQLLLLKPKLAYQAARQKQQVQPLADVLSLAIDHVGDSRERFQRFVQLFEAILAYHTKYGGK